MKEKCVEYSIISRIGKEFKIYEENEAEPSAAKFCN